MKNIILFLAFLLPLSLIGQINFNTLPSASSVTPTTPFPTVNTGGNWRKVSADLMRAFIMPRPVTRVSPTNRYVLGYVSGSDSLQYIPGGLMSQLPIGSVTVAAATNSLTLSGLGGLNFNTTSWGSGWVNRVQLSRSGSSTLSLLKGGQTISISADTLTGASMRWNNIGFRAKSDSMFITPESMDSITVGEALVVAAKFSDKAYIKSKSVSGSGGAPTGAAGGDLTGTYPNPTIGNSKIISAYVLDGTLVNADLASQTIDSNKIKNGAITPIKINKTGATGGQVLKYNSTTGLVGWARDSSLFRTDGTIPSEIARTITLGSGASMTLYTYSFLKGIGISSSVSGATANLTNNALSTNTVNAFNNGSINRNGRSLTLKNEGILNFTSSQIDGYLLGSVVLPGIRKYTSSILGIDSTRNWQSGGFNVKFDSLSSGGRSHFGGFIKGYIQNLGSAGQGYSINQAFTVQTLFTGNPPPKFDWFKIDNLDTDTTSNRISFYNNKYVFPNSAPGSGNKMIEWQSGVPVFVSSPSGGSGITALTGDVTASGTGSVTATISANAVTNAKIASNTIDSTRLAPRSVNTSELVDGSATAVKIASNAVDSTKAANLSPNDLAQTGASTNDVLTWTGSKYAPRPASGGSGTTDIINIVNLGAVGDGTTDNLTVIQNGLNTYGAIYIPNGNFKVSGTLAIPVGGKILGSGANSIISISAGDTVVRMRLNSSIENVTIDGTDAAGQVGVSWKGLNVVGVTVLNCYITDMIQGIRVDSVGYGPYLSSKIRGNSIKSCVTGIYMGQRAEYVQLLDNLCEQNTTGMYIRAGNCSIVGGSTNSNSIGISIDGGANNAHTSITGLSSNHNSSKSLEIDSISLGLLITGCNFFAAPNLTINESNSIQFVNNNIECTTDHVVTNSTELIYTNNIWFNSTSDPTLNSGSKAQLIGNRVKGTQAVTTISAPGTSGDFPLNVVMPSTGNRGWNITREGVSSSSGFFGLWSQTSTPGIFSPFIYSRSSSNASPHLAFIAQNDASGDTGSQPSISFQAGDGYSNLTRPMISFDAQLNDIAMRINVGKNVTIGHSTTRQDSSRLSVRGLSNSATSYSFSAFSLDNTARFRVANNGVITTTSTIYRNTANTVGEFIGTGSPEGVTTANPGSLFVNSDGTNPALYVKRAGTGNTNWNEAFIGLRGSATLDFGSTAAGAVTDLTITVTGAADGDVVSLGVPNASVTATGRYFAWVSAANTVTVRFSPTILVGSEDPASGTFKVTVTK